jgi:hypothetical protein
MFLGFLHLGDGVVIICLVWILIDLPLNVIPLMDLMHR